MVRSNVAHGRWLETLQTKLIFSPFTSRANCTAHMVPVSKLFVHPTKQPTYQPHRNELLQSGRKDEREIFSKWIFYIEACTVQDLWQMTCAFVWSHFHLDSNKMSDHIPNLLNSTLMKAKFGILNMSVWQYHCAGFEGVPIDWMTTSGQCVFKGNGVWGKCGNWDFLMVTKILHSKQWLLCVCPLSKHGHFLHGPTEVSAVLIAVITFGTNQQTTFNLWLCCRPVAIF